MHLFETLAYILAGAVALQALQVQGFTENDFANMSHPIDTEAGTLVEAWSTADAGRAAWPGTPGSSPLGWRWLPMFQLRTANDARTWGLYELWAIRVNSTIQAPRTGEYMFRAYVDDWGRCWRDEGLMFTATRVGQSEFSEQWIRLVRGETTHISCEISNHGGPGQYELQWQFRNQSIGQVIGWRDVDAAALFAPATDIARVKTPDSERAAVVAMYQALSVNTQGNRVRWRGNGDEMIRRWEREQSNASPNMCEDWPLIECNFIEGEPWAGARVTRLDLYNRQLQGQLENAGDAFAQLPYLESINADWNNALRGYLPQQLSTLARLSDLRVSGTRLDLDAAEGLQTAPPALSYFRADNMVSGSGNSIGGWVSGAAALVELRVQSNGIRTLPTLSGLVSLAILRVGDNDIQSLGSEVCGLSGLVHANVSDNPIATIAPCFFATNTAMRRLYLHGNKETLALPLGPSTAQLSQLEILELFDSQITSLGNMLDDTPGLVRVRLDGNRLGAIGTQFAGVQRPALEEFFAYGSRITSLPKTLFQGARALHDVRISGNRELRAIPDFVGPMPDFTSLQVVDCGIDTPVVLRNMSELVELQLQRNQLSTGPVDLGTEPETLEVHAPFLVVVDLSDNEYTTIPAQLLQPPSMRQIQMERNRITSIPAYVVANETQSALQVLLLSSNLIALDDSTNTGRRLPLALVHSHRLQRLDLSLNPLAGFAIEPGVGLPLSSQPSVWLPSKDALGLVDALEEAGAQFDSEEDSLPSDGDGELHDWTDPKHPIFPALTVLQISNASMPVQLPRTVCRMTNLEVLEAEHNSVRVLPECLVSMQQLRELRIRGNAVPAWPRALQALYLADGDLDAFSAVQFQIDRNQTLPSGNLSDGASDIDGSGTDSASRRLRLALRSRGPDRDASSGVAARYPTSEEDGDGDRGIGMLLGSASPLDVPAFETGVLEVREAWMHDEVAWKAPQFAHARPDRHLESHYGTAIRAALRTLQATLTINGNLQLSDDAAIEASVRISGVLRGLDRENLAGYGDAGGPSLPRLRLTRESLALLSTLGDGGILPRLRVLDAGHNRLASAQMAIEPVCRLPSFAGLTELRLDWNGMFGLIPHCLFTRSDDLRELHLRGNLLVSRLPANFYNRSRQVVFESRLQQALQLGTIESANSSAISVHDIPDDSPYAGLIGFDAPDQVGGPDDVSVPPEAGHTRVEIWPSSLVQSNPGELDYIDFGLNALSGTLVPATVHNRPGAANAPQSQWPIQFNLIGNSVQCPVPASIATTCNSDRCALSECIETSIDAVSADVVAQLAEVELIITGASFQRQMQCYFTARQGTASTNIRFISEQELACPTPVGRGFLGPVIVRLLDMELSAPRADGGTGRLVVSAPAQTLLTFVEGCPPGFRSTLPPGQLPGPGELACQACPPGLFTDLYGEQACRPCPAGFEAPTTASTQCTACSPTEFASTPASPQCRDCLPGTFSNTSAATTCTPCSPGFFSNVEDRGVSECTPCPPGRFSGSGGAIECELCDVRTFQPNSSQPECQACPANARTLLLASTQIEACLCEEGFYQQEPGGGCFACPNGASCSGMTRDPPRALPGFWVDMATPYIFFQCAPEEACLGFIEDGPNAGNATCAEGYSGRLCGTCTPLEFYELQGRCVQCPPSTAWLWGLLAVLALGACAGLLMFAAPTGRKIVAPAIGLSFVQILSIFHAVQVEWPNLVVEVFSVTSIANANVELFSPDCSIPMSFFGKWGFKMMAPAFVGSILLLYYLLVPTYIYLSRSFTGLWHVLERSKTCGPCVRYACAPSVYPEDSFSHRAQEAFEAFSKSCSEGAASCLRYTAAIVVTVLFCGAPLCIYCFVQYFDRQAQREDEKARTARADRKRRQHNRRMLAQSQSRQSSAHRGISKRNLVAAEALVAGTLMVKSRDTSTGQRRGSSGKIGPGRLGALTAMSSKSGRNLSTQHLRWIEDAWSEQRKAEREELEQARQLAVTIQSNDKSAPAAAEKSQRRVVEDGVRAGPGASAATKGDWKVNPLGAASAWSPQKRGHRPFAGNPQTGRQPNPRLLLREALVEHALLRKDGTMTVGPMWARPFLRENEELLGDLRLPAGLRRRQSSDAGSAGGGNQAVVADSPGQFFTGVGFGGRRRAPRFHSIFGQNQLENGAPKVQARLKAGPKSEAMRAAAGIRDSNNSLGGSTNSSFRSFMGIGQSKRGLVVPWATTAPLLRGIAAARRPAGAAMMMASKRSIQSGLDDGSVSNIFGSRRRSRSLSRRSRRSLSDSQRNTGDAEQSQAVAVAAAASAARQAADAVDPGQMKELMRLMKGHAREYETRRLRLQRLRTHAVGAAMSDSSNSSSSSSGSSGSSGDDSGDGGSNSDPSIGSQIGTDEGQSRVESSPGSPDARRLVLAEMQKSGQSSSVSRSTSGRTRRRGLITPQDSKSKLQLMAVAAGLPDLTLDEDDRYPRDVLAVSIAPDTRTDASRAQWRGLFLTALRSDTMEQRHADRLLAKSSGGKHQKNRTRRGGKAIREVGADTDSKGWFGGLFGGNKEVDDPWLGYWLSNPLRMLGKRAIAKKKKTSAGVWVRRRLQALERADAGRYVREESQHQGLLQSKVPRASIMPMIRIQAIEQRSSRRQLLVDATQSDASSAANPLQGMDAASTASEQDQLSELPFELSHVERRSTRPSGRQRGQQPRHADNMSVSGSVKQALRGSKPHPKRAFLAVGASVDGSLSSESESGTTSGTATRGRGGSARRTPSLRQLQVSRGESEVAGPIDSSRSIAGLVQPGRPIITPPSTQTTAGKFDFRAASAAASGAEDSAPNQPQSLSQQARKQSDAAAQLAALASHYKRRSVVHRKPGGDVTKRILGQLKRGVRPSIANGAMLRQIHRQSGLGASGANWAARSARKRASIFGSHKQALLSEQDMHVAEGGKSAQQQQQQSSFVASNPMLQVKPAGISASFPGGAAGAESKAGIPLGAPSEGDIDEEMDFGDSMPIRDRSISTGFGLLGEQTIARAKGGSRRNVLGKPSVLAPDTPPLKSDLSVHRAVAVQGAGIAYEPVEPENLYDGDSSEDEMELQRINQAVALLPRTESERALVRRMEVQVNITNRFVYATITLLSVSYTFLATTALEPLSCVEQPDGSFLVRTATEVQCYTQEWNDWVAYVLLAVVVYVVGVPVIAASILLVGYSNGMLGSSKFDFLFGSLTLPYVKEAWAFELVQLARKGLVVAVIMFTGTNNSTEQSILQIVLTMSVFVVYAFTLSVVQPYEFAQNNRLAVGSSLALLFCLFSAVLFSFNEQLNDTIKLYLSVCVVIVCIVTLASVLLTTLMEVARNRKRSDDDARLGFNRYQRAAMEQRLFEQMFRRRGGLLLRDVNMWGEGDRDDMFLDLFALLRLLPGEGMDVFAGVKDAIASALGLEDEQAKRKRRQKKKEEQRRRAVWGITDRKAVGDDELGGVRRAYRKVEIGSSSALVWTGEQMEKVQYLHNPLLGGKTQGGTPRAGGKGQSALRTTKSHRRGSGKIPRGRHRVASSVTVDSEAPS